MKTTVNPTQKLVNEINRLVENKQDERLLTLFEAKPKLLVTLDHQYVSKLLKTEIRNGWTFAHTFASSGNVQIIKGMLELPNSLEILKLQTVDGNCVAGWISEGMRSHGTEISEIGKIILARSDAIEILKLPDAYGELVVDRFVSFGDRLVKPMLSRPDFLEILKISNYRYGCANTVAEDILSSIDTERISSETKKKVLDQLETSGVVKLPGTAYHLIQDSDNETKARVFVILNKVTREEERLTTLIFSHMEISELLGLSTYVDNLFKHVKKNKINFLYDFIAQDIGLSEKEVQKLSDAINSTSLDIKKALPARGLAFALAYSADESREEKIKELKMIFGAQEGKSLIKALELFPSLYALVHYNLIDREFLGRALKSSDPELELQKELVSKMETLFKTEVLSTDAKVSLLNKDFIVDLATFKSRYPKGAPAANIILENAIISYFKGGIEGFKQFKFSGHELAVEQLSGASHVKEILFDLDKMKPVSAGSKDVPIDRFDTSINNYNMHKENLHRYLNDETLKGLHALRELSTSMPKIKDSLDYVDSVVEELEQLKDKDTEDQRKGIVILMQRVGENAKAVLENLEILKRGAGSESVLAVRDAMSIIKTLVDYRSKFNEEIVSAEVTFDPSKILTFGRYGNGGAGNCQRSTGSINLNQSLMSMLADSNQFMFEFKSAQDGTTLGFMQVHLLQSTEKGMIFLAEKPYANEANKASAVKEAASLLANRVKQKTGIDFYVKSTEGEILNVTIPESYVSRFIDFVGQQIDQDEMQKQVTLTKIT